MMFGRGSWIIPLVICLCACGNSNTSNEKSAVDNPSSLTASEKETFKIALVLKTLTNPFFIEVEKGARRAEKEFGVELQVKTGSQETAIEQQIQIIEELIELKIDALVITPGDSKRLIPILKKAQSNGIFIVTIDDTLDSDLLARNHMQQIPFVSVNNEEASYNAVKYVSQRINKPTKAAIVGGMPGAENARLRLNGAIRAFKENPSIHVVAQETAHWKIDEAYEVAARILMQNPDVGFFFCANDMMALGVIKYLQESGRKAIVVGYDALDEARASIVAGTMAATVDQQAAEQGYQGVALAVRSLKGEALPPVLKIDAQVVTAETLK